MKSTDAGAFAGPLFCITNAISSSAVTSAPGLLTTTALAASPAVLPATSWPAPVTCARGSRPPDDAPARRPGQVRAVCRRAYGLHDQRPARPAAFFRPVPSNPAGPGEFPASATTVGQLVAGPCVLAGRARRARKAPTGGRPRYLPGAVPGAGEPVSLTGEVRRRRRPQLRVAVRQGRAAAGGRPPLLLINGMVRQVIDPASSRWMSCLTTSATRRSWSVSPAVLIACAAASSHHVALDPMTSITVYTLMWLDGVVALGIAAWAVVEGRRAWAGKSCGCACEPGESCTAPPAI